MLVPMVGTMKVVGCHDCEQPPGEPDDQPDDDAQKNAEIDSSP